MLSQTNPTTTPPTAAAVDCLFGFTGRPLDASTGLQNNWHRWYNPAIADWMSRDPDDLKAGDTNPYRYCGNSPTNATDPTGLGGVAAPKWNVDDVKLLLTVMDSDVASFWKRYQGFIMASAPGTLWGQKGASAYYNTVVTNAYGIPEPEPGLGQGA